MDFEIVRQALALTGAAGEAVKSVSSAVEAVRAKVRQKGSEVPADLQDLIVELSEKVADAKMANVELSVALSEIRMQLLKEDEFTRERAHYRLIQTVKGYNVWELKIDCANGEAIRYACPNCMNDHRISFIDGVGYYRVCQSCKHGVQFSDAPKPPTRRVKGAF